MIQHERRYVRSKLQGRPELSEVRSLETILLRDGDRLGWLLKMPSLDEYSIFLE